MSTANLEPDDNPESVPSRWETELDDILRKSNLEPTSVDRARSTVTSMRYQVPGRLQQLRERFAGRSPMAILMLVIAVLALGSFVVGHFIPILGRAMAFGALIAVGVLLVLLLTGKVSRSTQPGTTWRGQDIGLDDDDRPRWRER